MYQFGNSQNGDASPGEHNLIDFVERPARRTQKCYEMFHNDSKKQMFWKMHLIYWQ